MKHYSINEISKITGLSQDTLRYYEKINLIRNITRNTTKRRQYTEKDLEWIQFLIKVKSTGMSLTTLKEYSELMYHKNIQNVLKRKQILLNHEKKMLQKQKEIDQAIILIHKKYKLYELELEELTEK